MENPIPGLKQRLMSHNGPLVLYGAGTVGRDVLSLLTRLGMRVDCLIDAKAPFDRRIDGHRIFKPDDPRFAISFRKEALVIVSIFNAYVSMPELTGMLTAQGWLSTVSFIQLFQCFSEELGDRYWLTNSAFYDENQGQWKAAKGIWRDEKSKVLYEHVIQYRATLDPAVLPEKDGFQYFPNDLDRPPVALRLIDCGAFDGDTLRQIRSLDLSVEAVAAFEPDLDNFRLLTKEVAKYAEEGIQEALAFPCGVWSETTQLKFDSGQGTGSGISPNGATTIQCVDLDSVLPSFRPNYIKMDIEGAEYAALIGARNIITKHRPRLAICLYHKPEHIWQIPMMVQEWNLSYDLHLRCHCFNSFELVLYAFPRTHGTDGQEVSSKP